MTIHQERQRENRKNEKIVDILNDIQSKHGLKQFEIAQMLGLDQSTLSRVANGKSGGEKVLKRLQLLEAGLNNYPLRWPTEKAKKATEARAKTIRMSVEDFVVLCAVFCGGEIADKVITGQINFDGLAASAAPGSPPNLSAHWESIRRKWAATAHPDKCDQ